MSEEYLKRGRFDQSFIVRMIKDFFFLLLFVALAELGLRLGLVVSHFHAEEKARTERAAERLASDVREIMLNTGGPVAARTVYPILERSLAEQGLAIAVEPTAVTIGSIEAGFGFTPHGIPARWEEGTHHAATVEVRADEFCVSCHGEAAPGDVLGTVTVRNYLATHIAGWWEEVRLTGLMGLVKILLHTSVLFFLLRLRMEPLMSLRAVVGELAKGASDLSLRAPVTSTDEFGSLAADLNHFLDRIGQILADLRSVLGEIATLNQRVEALGRRLGRGVEHVLERIGGLRRQAPAEDGAAASLEEEARGLRTLVDEMSGLEERMSRIAARGGTLVDRLQPPKEPPSC